MSEHTTKITREMDEIHKKGQFANLQPAKTRFCILINGNPGTHKTSLGELIVKTMAKSSLVVNRDSFASGTSPKLGDKLPRLRGKEVVLMNDYNGANHNGEVLERFTSRRAEEYRVMNGYEGTTFLKGILIPSPHHVETWITHDTSTLNTFMQAIRRTHCTLHIFASKDIQYGTDITGNDFKDRLFYIGEITQGCYETILNSIPNIGDEPLGQLGRTQQLATSIHQLMIRVLNDLYHDKSMGGSYHDRSNIPTKFGDYQPPTELGTEPNIIRTFKIPSYEGLAERINALGDDLLKLPPRKESNEPESSNTPIKKNTPNTTPSNLLPTKDLSPNDKVTLDPRNEVFLDIETSAFTTSPLLQLALKTIQINQTIYETSQKSEVIEAIKDKTIVAFNTPFEQTHLSRNGYAIGNHRGMDVSLLARLYDNRLAEANIDTLAEHETTLLGTTTKKGSKDRLTSKYGGNFFAHPNIEHEPLFKEYSLNDTRVTEELYHYLGPKVDQRLALSLQNLHTKLARGQAEGLPFPRERILATQKRIYTSQQLSLERIVDIRIGSDSKASLKGGSSSKLKTLYIGNHKPEGHPYLEKTQTGLCFDTKAKEHLITLFPNDLVLRYAYDIAKKKTRFHSSLRAARISISLNSKSRLLTNSGQVMGKSPPELLFHHTNQKSSGVM